VCVADAELYGVAGWADGAESGEGSAAEVQVPVEGSSDGWSFVTMIMLFGVLLAVIAVCVRYIKKDPKVAAGYEKTMA